MSRIGNCLCARESERRRPPRRSVRCYRRKPAVANRRLPQPSWRSPPAACALLLAAAIGAAPVAAAPPCPRPVTIDGDSRCRDAGSCPAPWGGAPRSGLPESPSPPPSRRRPSIAAAARRQLADLALAGPSAWTLTTLAATLEMPPTATAGCRRRCSRDDGLWLQGRLLAEGLARVHPTPQEARPRSRNAGDRTRSPRRPPRALAARADARSGPPTMPIARRPDLPARRRPGARRRTPGRLVVSQLR